ncbi:MAG: RidA family protein [SAR202 cluster bacterium]|nr:RidA family protein [SAR202 cluster bacterium]
MARQAFFPDPNKKPSGFSPATRVGNTVHVSGQVALDASGKLVGAGDGKAQAEQCFRNLEAALKAAGGVMDDLVKITCFLVNVDDYPAYAAVRQRLFPSNGPASSTVVIKALVKPEFLIEIEGVALLSQPTSAA